MQSKSSEQFASSVWKGVVQASPIMMGIAPIGIAFGVLAQQAGLGLWPTLGLSIFVFAGASQFMAVSMMQNGLEPGAIIGATFIVNFRHVLMAASVAPCLKSWKTWQRVLFGGMMTDETFLLNSLNFAQGSVNVVSAVSLNFSFYITWIISGMAGYNLGALIVNPEVWGLDFALPAMFVGLLISACKNKAGIAAAIAGGIISMGLHLFSVENWAAFFGAFGGATVGVMFYMKEDADS